jgi:hypothetical protein
MGHASGCTYIAEAFYWRRNCRKGSTRPCERRPMSHRPRWKSQTRLLADLIRVLFEVFGQLVIVL